MCVCSNTLRWCWLFFGPNFMLNGWILTCEPFLGGVSMGIWQNVNKIMAVGSEWMNEHRLCFVYLDECSQWGVTAVHSWRVGVRSALLSSLLSQKGPWFMRLTWPFFWLTQIPLSSVLDGKENKLYCFQMTTQWRYSRHFSCNFKACIQASE